MSKYTDRLVEPGHRLLDRHQARAVLVRRDHYVFDTGDDGDAKCRDLFRQPGRPD